jgi:hypothetical protein
MGGHVRREALGIVHRNLVATAESIGIEWEMVVCIREPGSWLAAWVMTHLLHERGPDRDFWEGPMTDPDLESLLALTMQDYEHHLGLIARMAGDDRVWVRCLERTVREEFWYTFDFAEYVRKVAPREMRTDDWLSLLTERKQGMEGITREMVEDTRYGDLLQMHRRYPIAQPDGSAREL